MLKVLSHIAGPELLSRKEVDKGSKLQYVFWNFLG